MINSKVKVSTILESQLPLFVREEFPLATEFLSQYYDSIEFQGAASDLLNNIDQYVKVNNLTSLVKKTTTSEDIESYSTTILVDSTKGFTEDYGLLKIDDELITYTGITTNSFTGCIRGFSGITSYRSPNDPENLVFKESISTSHQKGSTVNNLSILFLEEFLTKVKKQFTPGFDGRQLDEDLNQNVFIKHARDFYSAKGTDESFKILFKALYGENVNIIKPRDYVFQTSDARYIVTKDLVVEAILGDPLKLVNKTLNQDKTDYSPFGYGSISAVEQITRDNRDYYIVKLDYENDKDITLKGSIYGEFSIHPKTFVINTEDLAEGSTVLSVDSTVGFPNSGTIILKTYYYTNNEVSAIEEIPISYGRKTINEFLDCSGIPQILKTNVYEVRIDDYAYGYDDDGNIIKVRVSGVISDLDIPSKLSSCFKGDNINVITLGKKGTTTKENDWVYNITNTYNVKSISLNSSDGISNQSYLITTYDSHIITRFDSIILESQNGKIITGKVTKVPKDNQLIVSNTGSIDTTLSYTITKQLSRPRVANYPEANSYNANIQNVYFDLDNKDSLYVAAGSLPNYEETLDLRDFSKTFNANLNESEEIVFESKHSFYTGDGVVYIPGSEDNKLNISEGVYFVKKINDYTIKLARSRSNINTEEFLSITGITTGNVNKFEYFDFSYQKLDPQNLIRKISKPNDDSGTYPTPSGFVGILKNGVEILNYKSKDFIYYGSIDSVSVLSPGSGYDIINPPVLSISDEVGAGCTGFCAVTGNLSRIEIVDGGFDYLENPTIKISGGNGRGARVEPHLVSVDHVVEFNSTKVGGAVDTANSIIGFSSAHRFRDGEKIFYKTYGQQGLVGLSTDSGYYVSVLSPTQIKLYETRNDALLKSDNWIGIGTTGYGVGKHAFKAQVKKKILGSVRVISPGINYQNRQTAVNLDDTRGLNSIDLATSSIKILNHGYSTGEKIIYSSTGSFIGGLSNEIYYVTKIDRDRFKLSSVGIGSITDDYYFKSKKYIEFYSEGSGTHLFNYPPISVSIYGRLGIGTTSDNSYQATLQSIFRGSISAINLANSGSSYGSPEIINFSRQPSFKLLNGNGASLIPIVVDGRIKEVLINYSGINYNSPPNLVVEGSGSGAILVPIVENGSLVDVKVVNGGYGYESSNTKILVFSPGEGAEFSAKIKPWNINIFERLNDSKQLVADDGVIASGINPSYGLEYSHVYAPRSLRKILNAVTISEQGSNSYRPDIESDSDVVLKYHSPIIGWAYDGNPIYGPYGFAASNSGTVIRMKSGYILNLNPDRPSGFRPGFFVEDYVYNATSGYDDQYLDEYNGRYCATPEYPNGVYAYFATIFDENLDTDGPFKNQRKPIFPYLIGNYFKSKPNDFNFKTSSNQNDIDLNQKNWVRNTFSYNFESPDTNYKFLINPTKFSSRQNSIVKSTSQGKVTEIEIISGGDKYQSQDQIIFNNENTGGTNAFARVSLIDGVGISSVSVASSTISYAQFIQYGKKGQFVAISTNQNNYSLGESFVISGLSTDETHLRGSFKSIIKENSLSLKIGIGSIGVTGIVTSLTVGGSLSFPSLMENDVLQIEDELVKVLNIDELNSTIRVLRGYKNTVSVAHSSLTTLTEKPRKLYFDAGFTTSFEYQIDREYYFNPIESVGLGTTAGVGISSALVVGIQNLNSEVGIATSSKTQLYFKNSEEVSRYFTGGYIGIVSTTTSTGVSSTGFHKSHVEVLSVGSTSITINFNTTSLQGIGVTAYISKEKIVKIPTKTIYLPNHGLKTGTKLIYNSNGGTGLFVSTDGKNNFVSLGSFDNLYAISINNDIIGISTRVVGYGSTGVIAGLGSTAITNTLYFTGIGTGSYHSFKTKYENVVTGDLNTNRVTVSAAQTHGLQVGDSVVANIIPSDIKTISVSYNPIKRRLVVDPKTFTESNVDLVNNTITINNHGYFTGQKVIYVSASGSISGLTNNQYYYVVVFDSNKFKLSESLYDSTQKIPTVVDLTSASIGSVGIIYQVNPPIIAYGNQTLVFDLSDGSLASNFKPSFTFEFYKDKNFKHVFRSDELDTFFEVKKSGLIGVTPTANVSITLNSSLSKKIFYNLKPVNLLTTPKIQREIASDNEVFNKNSVEIVESLYNGKKTIIGITTNTFQYSLPSRPEKTYYQNNIDSICKYQTNSPHAYGPISSIDLKSGGNNYKVIPGISTVISDYGSGAILHVNSTEIGKIKKIELKNIGFDYPSDKTLSPSVKLPQILKVSTLSIIDKITVSYVGKYYLTSPKLIALDGITREKINDLEIDYKIGEPEAYVVKNTEGINDVVPIIIPTNNSNGIRINNISFDIVSGVATAGLAVSYSNPEDFPFSVGDRIFVEHTNINSTYGGLGYNSKDYGYKLFTIVSTDPNIGGENGSVTYDMSEYIGESYPGVYDKINSVGTIVPESYFPSFNVTLKQRSFIEGENIVYGDNEALVEKWYELNRYLKVSTDQSVAVGDLIVGKSSKTKAKVLNVETSDSQYNISSNSVVYSGFDRKTGFLNENSQRIHDNDYYQYFSYSINSKVPLNVWEEPVTSLNHISGFKKFSDLTLESIPSGKDNHADDDTFVGIKTDQDQGSFYGINDITRFVDLNCVTDFDLVTETSVEVDGDLVSEKVIFDSRVLQDYSESISNRVLEIDDISDQFINHLPRTYVEVDEFILSEIPSKKYFAFIKDTRFKEIRQVVNISLLQDQYKSYLNEYGKLYTVDDLGSFDFNYSDVHPEQGILSFYPTHTNLNSYTIDLISYNPGYHNPLLDKSPLSIGDLVNINSGVTTYIEGNPITIAEIPINYNSSKLLVQIKDENNKVELNELSVLHDDSDVYISEYGRLSNNNSQVGLGQYNAEILDSNVIITFTPYFQNTGTINTVNISIANTSASGIATYKFDNSIFNSYSVGLAATGVSVASTVAKYDHLNVGENYGGSYCIVSVADTTGRHQLSEIVIIDDEDKSYSIEYGSVNNVNNNIGLGTFGVAIIDSQTHLHFTPFDLNVDTQVSVFQQSIGSKNGINTISEINITEGSILTKSSTYYGTEYDGVGFNLNYKGLPIFEREFNPSDPSVLSISNDTFYISNHFFTNGEEISYSIEDVSVEYPIGIATTTISGIGTTSILPSTVYVIKSGEGSFKLAATAQKALAEVPQNLNITNCGLGRRHKFTSKDQTSKALIAIDNAIQSPMYETVIKTSLSTSIALSGDVIQIAGISSISSGDLLKINNEIVKVDRIGAANTVTILRGRMGTSLEAHSIGSTVTKMNGQYTIIDNRISFVSAPYGSYPVETSNQNERDYVGIATHSSFSGRVFTRSGVPNSTLKAYSDNYIYDDISHQFNGISTSFTLKSKGLNPTGIQTYSPIVLVRGIFQNIQRSEGPVFVEGSYDISENSGISTINFLKYVGIQTSDVNVSNIPNGGIIVSVGSSQGFGYQPLVSAGATITVSAAGTITNISIGNSGSGYRSGYQPTVNVFVRNSQRSAQLQTVGYASISNGYITSITLSNPGVGLTNYINSSQTYVSFPVGSGSSIIFVKDVTSISSGDYISVGAALTNVKIVGVGSTAITIGTANTISSSISIGSIVSYKKFSPPKVIIDSPLNYNNLPLKYSKSSSGPGLGTGATVDIIVGQGSSIIDFNIKNYGFGYKEGEILTVDIGGSVGVPTAGISTQFKEFQIFVNGTYNTEFSAWSVGELQLLDNISNNFNGRRRVFTLKLEGKTISINTKKGSNIDLQQALIIFINDVLQIPGQSYTFKGGSTIQFLSPPRGSDENYGGDVCKILFYRGTRDVDVIDIDILETVKAGDTVDLTSEEIQYQELERVAKDIESTDTVITNPYSGIGVVNDPKFKKSLTWCKQTEDRIIDGQPIGKDRILYEPLINPIAYAIRNIGINTTQIFVDSINPFFNSKKENIGDKLGSQIQIYNPNLSLVSAAATAIVSAAGTVQSIAINNGGSGYSRTPLITISNPYETGSSYGASATASITSGVVTSIVVNNPGIGYTLGSAQNVSISSTFFGAGFPLSNGTFNNVRATTETGVGRDITLDLKVVNDRLVESTITNGGFGYSLNDKLIVSSIDYAPKNISTKLKEVIELTVTSITEPKVFIEPPTTKVIDNIKNVTYVGDSGIISGIKTTTIGGNPGLILDFLIPNDSWIRNIGVSVGFGTTGISGIQTGYFFVVKNSSVGNGVTSYDLNGNMVGIGTTCLDNVYQAIAVSLGSTSALGIGVTNLAQVTVRTSNNNISGLGYSGFYGEFTWGKISTPGTNTLSFDVNLTNGISGLATAPVVRRKYPLKYDTYTL
jgi:hypothetical protein